MQERDEMDEHFEELLGDHLPPKSEVTAPADITVREAVRLMVAAGRGHLVVTVDGELGGLFTERDLLMRLTTADGVDLDVPLSEVMTRNPVTLTETNTIATAVNQMALGRFRHLPVADTDGKLAGVYSVREMLRKLYELRQAEETGQ